ncbi:serine/threonine-protein kinase [Nocardioides panacisoli]|uniref:Protein kinase domain-containing protein n=1 Tax=Nocardioides panacisoli TaxID=627624 RepID=A0ABP7I1X3_9ACTN
MTGTEQEAAAADPPLLADRYDLIEVIGRGGMADVYRATDVRLDRPVAVKMLLSHASDQAARDRFIAEARTLAVLSHRGLVTLLDAGFGSGLVDHGPPGVAPLPDRPFLVMELVDGPSLAALIGQGPLPLDHVGSIAVQVAEALAYVHAQGVVHRDVKPANVLVGPELVKLGDFGVARLVEQTTRHTQTGQTIGTAAYLAPEQVEGAEVSGATDVYSLGLVLLEAMTGRREYEGAPAEAALARLHRAPAVPPDVPPAWRDLLMAMTALVPADRPTAAEVAATVPRGAAGPPAGVTRPMPAAGPTTTQVRRAVPGEPREPVGQKARAAVDRVRALPRETVALVGGVAALLLFLVLIAVFAGGGSASDLPGNTPTQLREPLSDLHQAVNGDGG